MVLKKFPVNGGVITDATSRINNNNGVMLRQSGRNLIRQLQDRSVDFSADGGEFAEVYSDSNGQLNSVNYTGAVCGFLNNAYSGSITGDNLFVATKYLDNDESGTDTYSGSSPTNETNAYDSNVSTYADVPPGDGATFGATFATARTIKYLTVIAERRKRNAGSSYNTGSINFKLQTYNGTTWEDVPLTDASTISIDYNMDITLSYSCSVLIDSSVMGVRLYTGGNNGTGSGNYMKVRVFSYSTDLVTTDASINHTPLTKTFSSIINSSFGTALVSDLEDGDNIQYKLVSSELLSNGSLSDPDGFTNPNNAFDNDDSTYAEYASDTTGVSLGKTFSSHLVNRVYIHASFSEYNYTSEHLYLEVFDGSSWNLVAEILSGSGGTSTRTYNDFYNINSVVQGIRLRLSYGDSVTANFKIYSLLEETDIDDSGWLNINEISEFTAFTSEPTKCIVKLIPKTSGATVGYPSIKGVCIYE